MKSEQYRKRLKRYVDDNYLTQKDAAIGFGCSPATLSLAIMGERSPTLAMLKATGYTRKQTVIEQYFRSDK